MRIFSDSDTNGSGPALATNALGERIRANLANVGATIALTSARGGVGKSMLAVNIAGALATTGRKVGIVDADLNSPSIGAMLGMKPPRRLPMVEGIEMAAGPHGLRIVSSDLIHGGEPPPLSFAMDESEPVAPSSNGPAQLGYREAISRMLAQSQFGTLDLLIVDLASGIDRLHSVATMTVLDGVIFVSRPSTQDTVALRNDMKGVRAIGASIVGIVENMVGFNCDGCRTVRPLWPEGGLPDVAREAEVPILGRLAFEPRLADCTDRGTLFVREYPSTPTGKTLADLASRVDTLFASRPRVASAPA